MSRNRTETSPRTFWNKVWISVLIVFCLLVTWFGLQIQLEPRRTVGACADGSPLAVLVAAAVSGLGQLIVIGVLLLIWFGGTPLLAIPVWLTRPATVVEPRHASDATPTPAAPWRGVAPDGLGLLVLVAWTLAAAQFLSAYFRFYSHVAPDDLLANLLGLSVLGGVGLWYLMRAARRSSLGRTSWTTIAARLLAAVILLVWLWVVTAHADVVFAARGSRVYTGIVLGLWAVGFTAFFVFLSGSTRLVVSKARPLLSVLRSAVRSALEWSNAPGR